MTDQPSAVDLEGAPMEAPVDAATATPPEEQQMGEPLGVTAALNIPKKSEAVNPDELLGEALGGGAESPTPAEKEKPAPAPASTDGEAAAAPLAETADAPAGEDDDTPYDEGSADDIVHQTFGDPDLHINQVMIGTYTLGHVENALRKLYPTEEMQVQAKKDPFSIFNLLLRAFRDGWGSNQLVSYLDVLVQKNAEGKELYKSLVPQSDKSLGSLGDGTTHKVRTKSVDLTDAEARDVFTSAISGLKRVKLLNSGFWVTIRRPELNELQDIYDAVDLESREVGYSIGPHFALVADLYIKKRFCEALIHHRIIRDSNLADIFNTEKEVFANALSFHDYEVLLHAVLSLMSRKGFRARVVCPECKKTTILEKIDIGSAKFVNRDLITPEINAWFSAKTDANGKPIGKRTLTDLIHYRDDILGYKGSYVLDFDPGKVRLHFRVPTMAEYFADGEMVVDRIRDVVNEKSTGDEDRRQLILANAAAHMYQMTSPWIGMIEQIDDEGNVVARTRAKDAILSVLDTAMQDQSDKPLTELDKFLAASKISYIGTAAIECPYCHAKPDVGMDQFYPLEVQTIFFGQLFRLLPAELMRAASTT